MPTQDEKTGIRRPIRSYVRREGRMTSAQQIALDTHYEKYGIGQAPLPDFTAIFGRTAPLILEIGFGMGDALLQMAQARPAANFIGVEVHRPGVASLLRRAVAADLTNIRVVSHDVVEVLNHQISDNSLAEIMIFFPDPWHKKKHHKRRLIQPDFVRLLAQKLQPGGTLFLATDWENYAHQMLEVLTAEETLANKFADGFAPRAEFRGLTKFELRGTRLGHQVWDLVFEKPGVSYA